MNSQAGPQQHSSRRTFLKTASATVTTGLTFPTIGRAATPDKVRLAAIGVGGKGYGDIRQASKGQIVVALCDVDKDRASKAVQDFPNAKFYTDWRKMLEKEAKNIDGVTISTPDHMHAPITMTALSMGLATYTQKPLTRTVYEARQLRMAAQRAGVTTQMGNQHHSGLGYRMLVQLIRSGIIGKIKEVHTWSNRPIWPQGFERPAGSHPIPERLDWDKWLGVAPNRPYLAQWPESLGFEGKKNNIYAPFTWRGWYDFGAGALGDMGCHIIDPVYWALELTAPMWVEYNGPEPKPEMFPSEETLTYHFPGTQYTDGSLTVKWYDGGRKPPRELAQMGVYESGPNQGKPRELPSDNGSLFIGTKGVLLCPHGSGPQLYPREQFKGFKRPRVKGLDHYQIWTDAIKGEGKTNSPFEYAGPLTETVLLGVIASRVPGERLQWDPKALRFTNSKKANRYVREEYRTGWEVDGLS